MNWKTQFMPYDVYERHAVTGQLLRTSFASQATNVHVLDVGGRIELLARFLPYHITSINPDGTGNVQGSGTSLPFAHDTFDAVVSIDTLEHLPAHRRSPFLQECARVSRHCVVIAAPYGSEVHIQYEHEIGRYYKSVHGRSHQYLSEHIQNGLPTPSQLDQFERLLAPAHTERYFAGDYLWQGKTFVRAIQAHHQPWLVGRLMNLYNRLTSMALFHPIQLQTQPNQTTNRFYLLIRKRPQIEPAEK